MTAKKTILEKNLAYEIIDCCNSSLDVDFQRIDIQKPEIKSPAKAGAFLGMSFGKKTARMNLDGWVGLLNQKYDQGAIVSRSEKEQKLLIRSVIKDQISIQLRAHAYMIFSGGFTYLKGHCNHGILNYQDLLKEGLKDEETSS